MPAAVPVFEISCGCSTGCERCARKRVVPQFRCPGKILQEAGEDGRDVRRIFALFTEYCGSGALPASGGYSEQAATVTEAFEVARIEKSKLEADRKQREKAAERVNELRNRRANFERGR